MQLLMNVTAEYGCCLNTVFAEFTGRRYEIILLMYTKIICEFTVTRLMSRLSIQFSLENYTAYVEYHLLDFVQGYIEMIIFMATLVYFQTNPPPYTDAAEQCISTRDSFISDDTCLDYYYTLGERFSAIAVNSAATAICASQTCKNRMSDYIDFLITCRLENIINDDDDDDDVSSIHISAYSNNYQGDCHPSINSVYMNP